MVKVVKFFKVANVLTVDEDFAALTRFNGRVGLSVYEFAYIIDTIKALNAGLVDVRIQVRPDKPKKPASIFAENDLVLGPVLKPTAFQIVQNIQLAPAKEKDIKSVNVAVVTKTVVTELTANISNELATTKPKVALSKFNLPLIKKFKLKTVASIKEQSSNTKPVLQISALQALPKKKTFPALTIKSLFQEKKDPSEMLVDAKFVTPAPKALKGLIKLAIPKPKLPIANTILANILKANPVTNTNDLIAEAVVPVLELEQDPMVRVTKTVKVLQAELEKSDSFFVTFELRNKGGIVVEKIERKVPHGQNIKIIQTPTQPPRVRVAPVMNVGRNTLEVQQLDRNASVMRMYRKTILPTVRLEDLAYDFVEDIPLAAVDGIKQIVDFTNNVNNTIYRFVPVGPQEEPSAEFTNVVSPGVRKSGIAIQKVERPTFAGVISHVVKEGIRIQIVNIPPGPIAVRIVRRDRTLHQIKDSDFVSIPHETSKKDIVLVDGENTPGSFLDTDLVQGHTYEYCCKLIYDTGDEVLATGCDFIEFIPLSEGVARTRVTAPTLVNREGGTDVTFNIFTKVLAKDLEIVKDLLEKQGLAELWQDELKNEKDSLQDLIAHSIRRVDLTTGQSEYFQTFTGVNFSDFDNREISSVSPLRTGHRYRYYVSALLRAPETLFEDNAKEFENKIGLKVNALPLKFKHPIVKLLGNIVTPATLKTNHSKDPFEFGNIGNLVTVDATLENLRPRLTRARAIKFNNRTNIVRWEVLGDKNLIDHFIIILDRNGQEEIVGKSHAIFDADFIEFIDKIEADETGSMRYRIIPVLTSYEHGAPVITNEVLI